MGIGKGLCRMISSATMALLKPELVSATAPTQTHYGENMGDEKTEAIWLLDARNAFLSFNCKAALHSIH